MYTYEQRERQLFKKGEFVKSVGKVHEYVLSSVLVQHQNDVVFERGCGQDVQNRLAHFRNQLIVV